MPSIDPASSQASQRIACKSPLAAPNGTVIALAAICDIDVKVQTSARYAQSYALEDRY